MSIVEARKILMDEMKRKMSKTHADHSGCVPQEIAQEMIGYLWLEIMEDEGLTEVEI